MTTFREIFDEYYTLYRAEAEVIATDDEEFTIGMRLANNGIRRWASYDNTLWKELFANSLDAGSGVTTTTAGTSSYAAPDDFQKAGGFVKLVDSNGTTQRIINIIEPHEAQFKADMGTYCYFSGSPNTGMTLHINPAPDTDGLRIEYVYYRQPTFIEDSESTPDMSNADFITNHMLANRFRASRNPYYSTAKAEAENMLGQMKMENDTGSWANPWTVPDRTGSVFGQESGNTWSW